jgi:hypothetical protein
MYNWISISHRYNVRISFGKTLVNTPFFGLVSSSCLVGFSAGGPTAQLSLPPAVRLFHGGLFQEGPLRRPVVFSSLARAARHHASLRTCPYLGRGGWETVQLRRALQFRVFQTRAPGRPTLPHPAQRPRDLHRHRARGPRGKELTGEWVDNGSAQARSALKAPWVPSSSPTLQRQTRGMPAAQAPVPESSCREADRSESDVVSHTRLSSDPGTDGNFDSNLQLQAFR